jgi:3-hydroxymyristoyl/3-hydroxydecanoyl-(acyl carrier protein) dehydratase
MGEASQANMLLASWLGADLSHDGQSRYRMLDLDLMVHGSPPRTGETLRSEITLERQVVVGGLRLFYFTVQTSADGRLVAQASFTSGLFTEAQLDQPARLDWDPQRDARTAEGPFEVEREFTHPRSFAPPALAALRDGHVADCFGESHRRAATHVRTPCATRPELFLLDSVTAMEPMGGPSGRGYVRATQLVTPDDWYFAAHLPGDPCMPGFILVEGAMQSLAFHLTATGLTIPRDGWRFEPAPGTRFSFRFRGQVVPQSATIVYEVFVESVSAGPVPRIVADVIARLDESIIFHGRRLALQLVPDWPLEELLSRSSVRKELRPVPGGLAGRHTDPEAATVDGIEAGYPSLLAFAWGRAQDAFGACMADLDGPSRWARIPAPPFLFVTRVTAIEAQAREPRPGSRVRTSWDIPETAWFFTENGGPTMPFAVLLEAMLQPAGWLMRFVSPVDPHGSLASGHIRNLDGVVTIHHEVTPGAGRLSVAVELDSFVRFGVTELFTVRIEAAIAGRLIGESRTTFGFFSAQALAEQVGLAATAQERARINSENDGVTDLRTAAGQFFSGALRLPGARLPGPSLLMIDQVTAFDPEGGTAGLGWARGEKTVDPDEWYFKAHFFQDPVQPGSLGLEMLLQLLQVVMIERDMGAGVPDARFEPVLTGRELAWKYRGQVLPENRCVVAEVEVTEAGRDDLGPFIIADGWLWVDGVRVYWASGLGMRIRSGAGDARPALAGASVGHARRRQGGLAGGLGEPPPVVQAAQRRRGPPVPRPRQPHECRHQHSPNQGGIHHDGNRHPEPEQLEEGEPAGHEGEPDDGDEPGGGSDQPAGPRQAGRDGAVVVAGLQPHLADARQQEHLIVHGQPEGATQNMSTGIVVSIA